MVRQAVAGVDLGTQTTKAVVVGVDGRHMSDAAVAVEVKRPRPGWVEQDPAALVESAVAALQRAVAALPDDVHVTGLAIAGQMGGVLGVDDKSTPITAYESWMDTRASAQHTALLDKFGDRILSAGGIGPLVGAHIRRWGEVSPDLLKRIAAVVAPVGHVTAAFTGYAVDALTCDRSQANLFGCYRARDGVWDTELAEAMGVPARVLPSLVDPTDIVGLLSAEIAARCKLPKGIPVAGGLGDGTAGWLAGGGVAPGRLVSTAGTSGHLAVTVDDFIDDPDRVLSCMPSAVPGLWYLIGFTNGTGLTHRHVAELHGGDFAELERAAALIAPGCDGLVCVPHMYGQLSPFRPEVRGVFMGFTERSTAAHYYRCVLEALSFDMADWIDRARGLAPTLAPDRLTTIGGGARSTLWGQIQADVLGIPVTRARCTINAARGAAMVAAAAVGETAPDDPVWFSDEAIARRHTPDRDGSGRYGELLDTHARLVDAFHEAFAIFDRSGQATTGMSELS